LVECTIPSMFELQVKIVLYIMLGGLVGLIYGLKRVLLMEKRIIMLEKRLAKILERKR